jgi:hypothetical protein
MYNMAEGLGRKEEQGGKKTEEEGKQAVEDKMARKGEKEDGRVWEERIEADLFAADRSRRD